MIPLISSNVQINLPNKDEKESRYDYIIRIKEIGNTHFKKSEYEKAIYYYNQCYILMVDNNEKIDHKMFELEQKNFLATLMFNIGVSYYHLNNYEKSLEAIDRALSLNPEYIKAYFRKAVILKQLKKYGAAIQIIEKLLSIDKGNKDFIQLLVKNISHKIFMRNIIKLGRY